MKSVTNLLDEYTRLRSQGFTLYNLHDVQHTRRNRLKLVVIAERWLKAAVC